MTVRRGRIMTEAELKEAVACHIVSLPLSIWQEMKKSKLKEETQAVEVYERIAAGIHTLYLQAGWKCQEQEYIEFWKDIVENPDGTINIEQVKKELADYKMVMGIFREVYCELTGDRISKVNTNAEAIIGQVREAQNKQLEQAGYVMLTRDEADLLLTCFKNESNRRYLKFSPDTEMEAKLRSRLEVKE
jgi:hypothetical protein